MLLGPITTEGGQLLGGNAHTANEGKVFYLKNEYMKKTPFIARFKGFNGSEVLQHQQLWNAVCRRVEIDLKSDFVSNNEGSKL